MTMQPHRSSFRSWLILLSLFAVAIVFLVYSEYEYQISSDTTEVTGTAMFIPYRIIIGQPLSSTQKKQVEAIIASTFDDVHQRYDQWNPSSEVSQLNRLPAGEHATLSPELASFLHLVDKVVTMTQGRFDPTMEPVRQLWQPHLEAGTKPSARDIAALRPHVGWHHIHLDGDHFSKDSNEVQLNLDAIAKGFAVDLIAHALQQAGYRSTFIEWGGEIKGNGKHPEGRPWRVYISGVDSSAPENAFAYVSLEDSAVATSGDYYQQWTVTDDQGDTESYCHVYDPRTLSPLQVTSHAICSASVVASSCAVADALATAAMVFSHLNDAHQWTEEVQERYPSVSFWLASRETADDN